MGFEVHGLQFHFRWDHPPPPGRSPCSESRPACVWGSSYRIYVLGLGVEVVEFRWGLEFGDLHGRLCAVDHDVDLGIDCTPPCGRTRTCLAQTWGNVNLSKIGIAILY